MIYGYIRVGTIDQNEGGEMIAIKDLSVPDKNIFIDKQSGKDFNRPQNKGRRIEGADLTRRANGEGLIPSSRSAEGGKPFVRSAEMQCSAQGAGRSSLLGSRGKASVGLRADSPYRGTGMKCPVRVKGEAPWRVEGGSPIGSRVKRLAQIEWMPCVDSYWVLPDAETQNFAASLPRSPSGKS